VLRERETMANNTLEQYLKDLRKSCNYSQEFVASHLNITRQTYSHYETGRVTPPVNSLYNLAKLYGVPVENFLDLVVTYNINMDFALKPQDDRLDMTEDLSFFIEYINAPENSKKFKFLNRWERQFLFYFLLMDKRDQDDILTFMKVKYQNRSKEKKLANYVKKPAEEQ
jgi:transcriptional regulator with XRE-family HTH domain